MIILPKILQVGYFALTCLPGKRQRLFKSKTCGSLYALVNVRLISAASSSPPRPSNSGVAFAEQSTKNSNRPSFGLSGKGVSSSAVLLVNSRIATLLKNSATFQKYGALYSGRNCRKTPIKCLLISVHLN